MKTRTYYIIIILSVLSLSPSCAPSADQLALTIENGAAVSIASTCQVFPSLTDEPTFTPLPTNTDNPTYTPRPTFTPHPTLTLLPTNTRRPTLTSLPTHTPTTTSTNTPTPLPTSPPLPTNPPVNIRDELWKSISITRTYLDDFMTSIRPVCKSKGYFGSSCDYKADCNQIITTFDNAQNSFILDLDTDDPIIQHALQLNIDAKSRLENVHGPYVNDCRNAIATGQEMVVPSDQAAIPTLQEIQDILHQAMAMLRQE